MAETQWMACCGILEVMHLRESAPKQTLIDICNYDHHYNYEEELPKLQHHPYVIFTDHIDMKYGKNFAKFIKKNRLGIITYSSKAKLNPNSGNNIRMWVWSVNWRAVKIYLEKHTKERYRIDPR